MSDDTLVAVAARPAARAQDGEEEEYDVPLICDSCKGDGDLRVAEGGPKQCKVCERAFMSFFWRPQLQGKLTKVRRTELCGFCAEFKHCCVSCLRCLKYGCTIARRDDVLRRAERDEGKTLPGVAEEVPKDRKNIDALIERFAQARKQQRQKRAREAETRERQALEDADAPVHEALDLTGAGEGVLASRTAATRRRSGLAVAARTHAVEEGGAAVAHHDDSEFAHLAHANFSHPELEAQRHTAPRYETNLSKVCSFFAKGACNRGDDCPYRHVRAGDASFRSHDGRCGTALDRFRGVDEDGQAEVSRATPQAVAARAEAARKVAADGATPAVGGRVLFIGGVDLASRGQAAVMAELSASGFAVLGGAPPRQVTPRPDRSCILLGYANETDAAAALQACRSRVVLGGKELPVRPAVSAARKEAAATSGSVPQLESSWKCEACDTVNSSKFSACIKCEAKKPRGTSAREAKRARVYDLTSGTSGSSWDILKLAQQKQT